MTTYLWLCKNVNCNRTVTSVLYRSPDDMMPCPDCGDSLRRDYKREGAHTAPVPGTGNPKFVRELEDKAARIRQAKGITLQQSEAQAARDQQAWQEKH